MWCVVTKSTKYIHFLSYRTLPDILCFFGDSFFCFLTLTSTIVRIDQEWFIPFSTIHFLKVCGEIMNCVSGGRFFTVVFLTYVKGSVLLVFLQLLLKRIAFKNELNRTQSLWSSWKVSIGSDGYNDNEKMSFCNSPIVKTFSIWAAVAIIVFDHYLIACPFKFLFF